MTEDQFMEYVIFKCTADGVKVTAENSLGVLFDEKESDLLVNGYFCKDDMVLKWATGKPKAQWFPTLVHEFCHYLQWKDNYWPIMIDDTATDAFWDMLEGKDHKTEEVKAGHAIAQLLEYDCERRTLALIKELDLPINLD